MNEHLPKVPEEGSVTIPATAGREDSGQGVRCFATRDRQVIRRWAERHGAEPATGEASRSGPATLTVTDGGVGIRFNFPGLARFRSISWEEWFEHFDRERLVFVYDEEVADRAYERWQHRGGQDGHDREDWLAAERDLHRAGTSGGARFRLLRQDADNEQA